MKNTVGTHIYDEYSLQEEEQILLQEVHLVSQEKIIFCPTGQIFLVKKQRKNLFVTENIIHLTHTVLLVIRGIILVT